MISKDQMMDVLLDACPSFRPTWDAFRDDWKTSANDLPHYLALADLARHLIGMLERSDTESFAAIFQVVERLQLEGDDYVQEAAVVGLLEDLQNRKLHSTTEPQQFLPFLGMESSKAWDQLYAFWQKVSAMKEQGLLKSGLSTSLQIDSNSIQDPELRKLVQQINRQG